MYYDCGFPGHFQYFVSTKYTMFVAFLSILISLFNTYRQFLEPKFEDKKKKEKDSLGVHFKEFWISLLCLTTSPFWYFGTVW